MPTKLYIPIPGSTERPLSSAVNQAIEAVRHWYSHARELRRQRKALALLDRRLLRDVGLTQDDVRRELEKPCW